MKIRELKIEGFRGFKEELTFVPHPKVNVFVGQNGSGKTTILEAIAGLLQVYVALVTDDPLSNYRDLIEDNDINYQQDLAHNFIKISWETTDSPKNHPMHISIERQKRDLKNSIADLVELKKGIEYEWEALKRKNAEYAAAVIAYYPTNRLFVDEKLKIKVRAKKYKHPIYQTYENALDSRINSFTDFESWYIECENRENRIRLRNDPSYRLPELEMVREAIRLFFMALHTTQSYDGPFVDDVKKVPKLFLKKGAVKLRLDKLSDGEKILLLLVSDIARRLALASPVPRESGYLKNFGIILIDELELHLHPSWQRNVIPALTKVFPGIQFIITTHSPQVLSNLKRENIHIIEDFQLVKEIAPVYGEDSNSILWEIFGVKKQPEHSEKAFSNFYKLLEVNEKQAKEALGKLAQTYGHDHLAVKKAKLDFEFEFEKFSDEV